MMVYDSEAWQMEQEGAFPTEQEQASVGVAWVRNQPTPGRHQRTTMMHRRRPSANVTLCGRAIPDDVVPSSVGRGLCKRCERVMLYGSSSRTPDEQSAKTEGAR